MKKSLEYEIKFYKSEHSGFQNSFYHSNNSYSDTGYCPTTSVIIKSYEELKQLCNEYNSPAFSKDSKKYDSEVNNLIRSFDSSYFDNKSLIICFGTGATGGILGKVKNITIEENILLINYKKNDAEQSSTVIINDPWVLIIEVNKQDVKDISQVKLIKKWGYITEGDSAIMSIEELILIPKEWTSSLNQTSNFIVNYNVTNEKLN